MNDDDDGTVKVSKGFLIFAGSMAFLVATFGAETAMGVLQLVIIVVVVAVFIVLPGNEPKRDTTATKPNVVGEAGGKTLRPPAGDTARADYTPIREVSTRAVHGRAPFAVPDEWAALTHEQRKRIADHVGRVNEREVSRAPPMASPHAESAPSSQTGSPPPIEDLATELRQELARLHEICQGESVRTRGMIERSLRQLDARKVPDREALREVQELFRALRLEKIAQHRRSTTAGARGEYVTRDPAS